MKRATNTSPKTVLAFVFAVLTSLSIVGVAYAESAYGPLPKIEEPGARCPEVSQEDLTNELVAESLAVGQERLENVRRMRELDLQAVCTMPTAKLTRAFLKAESPKPDSPGEWASFRAQEQSVNGVVKPDGLYQGFVQRQALVQAQRSPVSSVAGISNGGWTSIGPGNIGGRIRTIAINPNVPSTLFVGGVAGGIWKSTDSGATWAPINDFMANLAISSLVFDPSNPAKMYAGTGEGFFNGDAVRGFGIFSSADGGATWNVLNSTNPTTAGADWYYVNRIATVGSLILAATNGGIYRSANAGASWVKVITGRILDIKIDPNNASNAVAGDSGGYAGFTTDGGLTWTFPSRLDASAFRVELAYARSEPGVVYASSSFDDGTRINNSNPYDGRIYKSLNGGATWSLISTPYHLSGQGWYNNTIWVDPTDASHVMVGGLNLHRSTNGGATFTQVSTWQSAPASPHADNHAIVADPGYDGSTNRKVYIGNDGGVYRAFDISVVTSAASSNGWTNLNNGLAITQFYGGAGHASAGTKIVGGTQDNGSLVYNGLANSWGAMFGGDGGYSAADSVDPNYFYGEYIYAKIHRSSNGGASSSYIYTGISDAGGSTTANFIAPFTLDPNNNNRMLAGGVSLWESVNVKAISPTWVNKKASTGQAISAIAVAEGNPAIVWVGHNDGSVYQSSNATAVTPTWTLVRAANARKAQRILIDKDNNSTVYVTYGGYAAANVWRTTDAGTNWTDISGVLPQVPVRGFTRYPTNANWLYAGTEVGVFASTDAGTTWSVINDGPANVSVDELFWFDNTTLVAVTHGRGMFKATVTLPSYALTVSRTGSGKVTSADMSIDCGATCTANYPAGTVVTLTATPTPGATFTGWGGACSGNAGCVVTMNAVNSVSANFTTVPDFPPGGVMPMGWVQGSGSNAAWAVVSDSTYSGTYGLRAGAIANSQVSSINYTGNFAAGMVSFARRVSSQGGFDFLKFYIDGVEQGSWSGEVPWGVVSYAITAGNHTVKWEYSKDSSSTGGSDTAWIDEVYLPLASPATNAGAAIVPWLYLMLLSD